MANTISFGIQAPRMGTEFTAGGVEFTLGSLVVLALWIGVSTAVLFTPQNIKAARSAIALERKRVSAERDAFSAFRQRLESLAPSSPTNGGPGTPTTDGGVIFRRQPDKRLRDVREAYRETVMAVDHYAEDYGESLPANLSAEFGDGVATAVTSGTELTPSLKSTLIAEVERADDSRAALLDSLANENARLTDAADEFSTLAQQRTTLEGEYIQASDFGDVHENWQRLQALEGELDDVLQSQQDRRANDVVVDADTESFYEYVYGGLSTKYPVLRDGVALADQFRDLENRLTRGLARTS